MSPDIRLVLDTNILAAAIAGSVHALELVLHWHAGHYLLCVSDDVLAEYRSVLPRVAKADADARTGVFDQLKRRRHILQVKPKQRLSWSPHEPDNRIAECAFAANANALVTRNDRHFIPWVSRHGIVVVAPRECMELLPLAPHGSA